jgi:hypothetical protein
MASRDHIPTQLQRDLMLEVGYRCALCKQTEPLEFEHIEEWSEIQEHVFSNMIVLCASCHGRKKDKSNPRHINRASLKQLKQNLILLNGRYSDVEKRILSEFKAKFKKSGDADDPEPIYLHDSLEIMIRCLVMDGLINAKYERLGFKSGLQGGGTYQLGILAVSITTEGKDFLKALGDAL